MGCSNFIASGLKLQSDMVVFVTDFGKTDCSDDFGDFKFDGLTMRSGTYRIEIEYQSNAKKEIEVDLQESISMETIWL